MKACGQSPWKPTVTLPFGKYIQGRFSSHNDSRMLAHQGQELHRHIIRVWWTKLKPFELTTSMIGYSKKGLIVAFTESAVLHQDHVTRFALAHVAWPKTKLRQRWNKRLLGRQPTSTRFKISVCCLHCFVDKSAELNYAKFKVGRKHSIVALRCFL